MPEEEKKKLSPLAVVAGAIGSVISMVVGSLFGASGTILGAALSSVTCSVGAFIFENNARRAHARVKARRERGKTPGDKFHEHLQDLPLERAVYETRVRAHLHRDWGFAKMLAVSGGMLMLCLGSAAVTLVTIEGATGKTLTSNLTGRTQYGTTLGGYATHSPSPAAPSPSYSSTSASPSATATAPSETSPDASPDSSPSSPPPSPDLTPSSLSPLPSGQVP